jgi:glycosyltransferase involved in cell wall biosynthesis
VRFSVIIPLYNKERTVARAIRSVLRQTVPDFEIVVVDDGSTDGGPRVAAEIGDPRIRVVHQQNQGVSAARNRGIAEARFNLLAFLDADDEWLPSFLAAVHRQFVLYPDIGLAATAYFTERNGIRTWSVKLRGLPPRGRIGLVPDYLRTSIGCVWSSAVCIHRCAFDSVGLFRSGLPIGEDLEMWLRVALAFPVSYCMEGLAVRHSDDSEQGRDEKHYPKAILSPFQYVYQDWKGSPHLRARIKRYATRHGLGKVVYACNVRKLRLARDTLLSLQNTYGPNAYQFLGWARLLMALVHEGREHAHL